MKILRNTFIVFIEGVMFEFKWYYTWELAVIIGVVFGLIRQNVMYGVTSGLIVVGAILLRKGIGQVLINKKWILGKLED